jgi:plasmid stabilization system protein ParE
MDNIADYLLGEGLPLDAVEDYVKRVYNAPKHLAVFPSAGKPGRMPNTREWLVKDTPYTLIYAARDDTIRILRVMHYRRRFAEQ